MHELNTTSGICNTVSEEKWQGNGTSFWEVKMKFELLVIVTVLFVILVYLRKPVKNKRRGDSSQKKGSSTGRKQKDIPGPSSLPLLGILHHVFWPGTDIFALMTEWGSTFREFGVAKGKVLFTEYYNIFSPVFIQKALGTPSPDFVNKPRPEYNMIGNAVTNGILCADYPIWSPNRKIISRCFSYKGLQDQLRKINLHNQNMIRKILVILEKDEKYRFKNGEICHLLNFTALGMILHTIMDLEISSEKERLEFHKQLMIVKNAVSQPLILSPMWLFHPLRSKQLKEGMAQVKSFVYGWAQRYKVKRNEEKLTMKEKMDGEVGGDEGVSEEKVLKCMMEEMLDEGFTDEAIFQETLTMIIGGHETTSGSLGFFLLRMALHPEHQEKCRAEVDALFERKLAEGEQSSLSFDLTMSDLNELRYLDRCMKENLRLAPIVPAIARRLDGPLQLEDGLILEAGAKFLVCFWAVHRDPIIYPEPEKFDPDRFLPEECKKRHPFAYLPFSAGPRNCLGWKIAPYTVKLAAALILRHFEVRTSDKWEDLEFVFDITLATKKDINLSFVKRSNFENYK